MEGLYDNSLIYPAGYDELAKRRAQRQDELQLQLAEKIARPADAAARGLGDIAIQLASVGTLQPTFDTKTYAHDSAPTTPSQTRALGAISLYDYMVRDAPSSTVTEQAVLGSADLRRIA